MPGQEHSAQAQASEAAPAAANGSSAPHITARIKIKAPPQLPSPVVEEPQADDEDDQESDHEGIPDQELQVSLRLFNICKRTTWHNQNDTGCGSAC